MLTEIVGESKYLSMQQLPLAHTWLFMALHSQVQCSGLAICSYIPCNDDFLDDSESNRP